MDQERKESFPSDFQKKMLWRAVTGIAIFVIGALLVSLVKIASGVLGYLQPVLVPVAVAGIIAYLLDPVVRWLQAKGLGRMTGIITVFTSFLLFFGILFLFVGSRLSQQVGDLGEPESIVFTEKQITSNKAKSYYGSHVRWFFSKDIAAMNKHLADEKTLKGANSKIIAETTLTEEELQQALQSNWKTRPLIEPVQPESPTEEEIATFESKNAEFEKNREIVKVESSIARRNFFLTKGGIKLISFGQSTLSWFSDSYSKILGFFGIILGFAMVPIYLYYFLKESNSIQAGWKDYVPLKASKFKDEVVTTLQEINGYLISFFRGQVLVAFIDGILVGIALTVYDLPYGILIGVVMALLGIIPFIGNIICLIPACIIAFFHGAESAPFGLSQWGYVIGVVAIFVIVQQINSLATAPKIVGDSVGLHPMTVIFSMLFWSLLLGGFLGALLAVPLTAAVKVIFRRYVWDRKVEPTLPRAQQTG